MTLQMMVFLLIDTIMILFIYKKMMYSVELNRLPDLQKKNLCLIEKLNSTRDGPSPLNSIERKFYFHLNFI